MMDGDADGPAARLQQLGKACRDAGIAERTAEERVALFIPTWNIETWLAYLDGEPVQEGNSGYPRLAAERECQRARRRSGQDVQRRKAATAGAPLSRRGMQRISYAAQGGVAMTGTSLRRTRLLSAAR